MKIPYYEYRGPLFSATVMVLLIGALAVKFANQL